MKEGQRGKLLHVASCTMLGPELLPMKRTRCRAFGKDGCCTTEVMYLRAPFAVLRRDRCLKRRERAPQYSSRRNDAVPACLPHGKRGVVST